jgi:hypothetical protein
MSQKTTLVGGAMREIKVIVQMNDDGSAQKAAVEPKTGSNLDHTEALLVTYKQSLEIRYKEADLLFQRFNFFIAGMSFLVAAFAAIIAATDADKLQTPSFAIAGLGVVLSFFFFFTNLLASQTIRKFDAHLLKAEGELRLVDPPFKKILTNAADYPCIIGTTIRCFDKNLRAYHTWLIPPLFMCFWISMLVFIFVHF